MHGAVAEKFLPLLYGCLDKKGITMRADEKARAVCPGMEPAKEEDFGTEYLDRLISVKVVSDIGEAIEHINRYNTGHSEAIVTKDYASAMRFLNEVDAAAVYVNASTRFTTPPFYGRRRVRLWRGDRHQHAEAARAWSHGLKSAYHNKICGVRERAGKIISFDHSSMK